MLRDSPNFNELRASVENARVGQFDRQRIETGVNSTLVEIKQQYPRVDDHTLMDIEKKISNYLPNDWFDKCKRKDPDETAMWHEAVIPLLENKGKYMRTPDLKEDQRKDLVQKVTFLMLGGRFLKEDGGEQEQKRQHIVDFGENKIIEGNIGLKDGVAIVCSEGSLVEQGKVKGRDTCVLAVMQILFLHAGYIRGDSHVNLIEAKGQMIDVASRIGALSDDEGGTLRLHDVEYAVRPVLEETKKILMDSGSSNTIDGLGTVEVEYFSYFEGKGDKDVYNNLMIGGGEERKLSAKALSIMVDEWKNGKNMIFGYTEIDQLGQYNENGHQRIINGVSMIDGEYFFHVIDPLVTLRNGGWVKGDNLVTHLTGPIFSSESKSKSDNVSVIHKDDVLSRYSDFSSDNKSKLIEWG